MSKSGDKRIIIDPKIWVTQRAYSQEYGVKLGTVSQWVKRAKAGLLQPVEFWEIPELNNLVLIKRPAK